MHPLCWKKNIIQNYCFKDLYTFSREQWIQSAVVSTETLNHWGRVTHICVGNLTTIGSDNGLSPGPRQAITWTNIGILLIGPIGTNFSEILIEIPTFSFKKMRLKVPSAKRRPFRLGLNVLTVWGKSAAATMVSEVTYSISPLNSCNVLTTNLGRFYYRHSKIAYI